MVWADVLLHAGLITQAGMTRYADERPRRPYVAHVRDALSLARPGAASPMETRLRLVVVVFGGLREPPLINEAIYDEDGNFLRYNAHDVYRCPERIVAQVSAMLRRAA